MTTIYGECEDFVNNSHGFGITTVVPNGESGIDVTTAPPVFNTVSGTVTIEGTWPNLLVSDSGAPGGGGLTYSFNSGAGIEVTGGPYDFTFSLKPTGIIAGDYGPVGFNQFGQATSVGQILSSVTGNNGIQATVEPLTGAVILEMHNATNSSPGVVTLYTTVGTEPYPSDLAITPYACQQLIEIEIASIAAGDSSVQLFFSPAAAPIDPASFANSTLLITTQSITVNAGSVLSINATVKLVAPVDCQIIIVQRTVTGVYLAMCPQDTSDIFSVYGSITGPFAEQLEVRAYKLGAVAPVVASLDYISLMVS